MTNGPNIIYYLGTKLNLEAKLVSYERIFFFFQNNTNFQIISLISTFSKLFRKLTFRMQQTRFWTIQIEFVRLDFIFNVRNQVS